MIYAVRNSLRLLNRYSLTYTNVVIRTSSSEIPIKQTPVENKDFKILLQKHKDKIVFSSYLEHEKLELGYFKYHMKTIKRAKQTQEKALQEKSLPPLPVALRYYVDKDRLLNNEKEPEPVVSDKTFQLPFGDTTPIEINEQDKFQRSQENELKSNIDQWMTNYEYFDDNHLTSAENDDETNKDWSKYYGTPDPSASISQVRCGGCGALLHCNDPAIPGYLPSELFTGRKAEELKTMECQRCHFLKEYNIALDVSVQAEEYEKLLQSIRYVKSLLLVMVDLLDFPCSLWPGIVDIIGTERPVIIVANKVDLLPGDSVGYLKRVKECLMTEIKKTKLGEANIKYVALISAKTGYGVEDLISAMFKTWLYKGDVFLVGSTNVGKSSLFNALLQSDYCKVHAVDIVKRATVSRWPGTTLNLLKFPINRPSGWKIRERSHRLLTERKLMKVEKEIRKGQVLGRDVTEAPSLIGHIGRTFTQYQVSSDNVADKRHHMVVFDENNPLFRKSKWLYDTPGVVLSDQILSLLTTEELMLAIPRKLIRPQTYYLREGASFFIGGLARVDLLESADACRFTIFCSESLPITVTETRFADELYNSFVGTELFAVPSGGHERLQRWPGLSGGGEMEFEGEGPNVCCGDIVLSSAGWVSVTGKAGSRCRVAAWTVGGRGLHRRVPALLPSAITLKGRRLRDTPAYMLGDVFIGDEL
ncbi:unnamed protein product [Danaus chrysippus]|uniref:(African queen) hypothetical protein n=1 Tax=Danaus chrysippus TaxID=151541 RepID=A0A8J2QZX7_9NEOP|nr:unnamed protein product [Danaus chrysippus]